TNYAILRHIINVMEGKLLIKGIAFIILVVVGSPGNTFILFRFAHIRLKEEKLKPTHIILMSLALVNLILLLNRVILQALEALGMENLLSDTQCKMLLFIHRVCRAMVICITSLLSCHQCISIAPANKHWIFLKQKVSNNVTWVIFVFFCFNVALYPSRIIYGRARRNITVSIYTLRLVHCDCDFGSYTSYILNGVFPVVREVIVVGLMVLASLYIVYILLQHRKKIMGMRSSDKDNLKPFEYRASRAVTMLVGLYVALFGMDTSVWIYTLSLYNVSADINDVRIFLGASYSALSPIVVIATNPKLHKELYLCSKPSGKTKSDDSTK
uniref:Vomeronasal type-1 receptor n=1 Tax=Leptobrachium leishanense TaxID=445787 RepID=A0A8C5MFU0_9ANUR